MKEKNNKKPIYKKWWFWLIIFIVFICIVGSGSDSNTETNLQDNESNSSVTETSDKDDKKKVSVVDFSQMTRENISAWCSENKIICNISDEYSDSVPNGSFVSQSVQAGKEVYEGTSVKISFSKGKKPSVEYLNALAKAKSYSDTLHMSKKGIYKQLTSEYGEQFPSDAAQYAVDNVNVDWNANALAKAKSYQQTMHMSTNAIYKQLISEYGEQFEPSEAQYAIDHLND